jgi:predicted HicB family RNase H-like nuclease
MVSLRNYSQFCDVGKRPPQAGFSGLFASYSSDERLSQRRARAPSSEISRNMQLAEYTAIMCHLFIAAEISHRFDTSKM